MSQKLKKPVRSKSGVTILTVVLPPRKCDHGTCIYCPGGETVPQSYTDKSPAVMRALALDFDIQKQVKSRLQTLVSMGHPTDKLEVIIIGGTFMQYPKEFRDSYIKGIFDTLNKKISASLEEAKKVNETAENRVVALCIENRPDNCSMEEIGEMLRYGATRIEIGVQIIDDEIYKKINRGHTVQDVIVATKNLKDAGFKVGYHIMPGLPYSNEENDMQKYGLVFSDDKFRPDQLKLYPCQIVEDSPLAKMYQRIGFVPYSDDTVKNIITNMIQEIPNYCRVMRIMREIPKEKMVQKPAPTSLRGDIQKELTNKGIEEIRMREVGFAEKEVSMKTHLKTTKYSASGGVEYFLEIINANNTLFGLLRLRIIPQKEYAFVRELHVYGRALKLGEEGLMSQHKGFGKMLLEECEKIVKSQGLKKIKIISGVGVRKYYEKQGYVLDQEKIYMEKTF